MTNSGSTSSSASRSLTTPTSRCRSSWVVSQVRVRIEPNFYRSRATTTRRLPTTGYPPTRCFVDLGSTTLYYSTLLLLLINSNPPKNRSVCLLLCVCANQTCYSGQTSFFINPFHWRTPERPSFPLPFHVNVLFRTSLNLQEWLFTLRCVSVQKFASDNTINFLNGPLESNILDGLGDFL